MKYFVFAFNNGAPKGGAIDLEGSFLDLTIAKKTLEQVLKESPTLDYGHIYDLEADEIIYHAFKKIGEAV